MEKLNQKQIENPKKSGSEGRMSSSDESDDDQTGRPAVQSSDDSASDSEHDEKPQDSASRLDLTVEKFLSQKCFMAEKSMD